MYMVEFESEQYVFDTLDEAEAFAERLYNHYTYLEEMPEIIPWLFHRHE